MEAAPSHPAVRASHILAILMVLAAIHPEITRAAVSISGTLSLLNQPSIANQLYSSSSLSNGLASLIKITNSTQRQAILNANVTQDWATDPYKVRLLSDAVESFLILFAPASIGAATLAQPIAPTLAQGRALSAPAGRGTTPNSDTVYSSTRTELSQGPFEIRVPPIAGRFYSVVVIDVYQNIIAARGSRQGITGGISLLVVGPSTPSGPVARYQNYQASLGRTGNADVKYTEVIQVPTDVAYVLFRVLVLSHDPDSPDLQNVYAYQAQTTVQPYGFVFDASKYANLTVPSQSQNQSQPGASPSAAAVNNASADPAWWFTWANGIVTTYPSSANYLSQHESVKLNRFSLLDEKFNFSSLPADQQAALSLAVPIGSRLIDAGLLNNYEYNFNTSWGVSTRTWGAYGTDYFTSAVVAKYFLLANYGLDSVYFNAFKDSDRNPLSGANGTVYSWTLKGGQVPYNNQTTGWWSFIAYNEQAILIENPIQRYTIGDRTTGLKYAANGDLTLYLSYRQPTDAVQKANWLPVTNTTFFTTLRIFSPLQNVVDGKWAPPALIKQ